MPRSKRDQASPSGSSRSIRSKLPSVPPRLSIAWTSVASRVAGTTGEPFSSLPWCERTMCRTAWASSGSKPSIVSIVAADQVVAERDLALQPAGVGEVDRQRVVVVGLGLADVVQQRAGDRDVAVDAREGGRGGADGLGDRDACGRAARGGRPGGSTWPPARPESAARSSSSAEEAVEQRRELRVLDRREQLAQRGLELLDRRPAGPRRARRCSYSSGRAARIDLTVIFAPYCAWTREPALDEDNRARRRAVEALLDAVPGDRLDGAGAIGDHEADEVVAVLAACGARARGPRRPRRPRGPRRARGRTSAPAAPPSARRA